ncbi:related to 5^-3^ exonuclease [Lecanosticta acicola]|uniref:Related to 5^-3^ exonuclease n=1 Tax=Lecanosticta acicola TaxID=111012 RepID=A0AAI8Z7J3_9PEZI|nr:related to 5^-3^ exonuclease [Lecanosticta acicola]
MGVTGLWQVLQPCARPIKIETLNRKRLAVDASIWIYQFLKAVRDKEGNALRNSHVVGFFRRICKLLFFGIKPVFVFDGGAPALKRQTIRNRKARREGRRDDAVRTAGKLLAVQMQRRAEEEEAQRRADRDRSREHQEQEETVPDEGLVYVDELQMTQQERQQNRIFRKKDQYHLPELDMSLSEMGGPNDPRVMSLEELQAYAKQFEAGEDINVYDFSKIDYDSPFFKSLPASDRYNILNAARLRSRLRMGHSKEQLDSMFPDRMAFSRFQIERVRERNELTQRLMHLNGFENTEFSGRIAGEKGREYVLVRNDGVEGGWALGVITDEGKEEKPIDIDKPVPAIHADDEEDAEEEEFEDVPIEGLNRLPKQKTRNEQIADDLLNQRRAVYGARKKTARRRPKRKEAQDSNSLFVQSSDEGDEEWEELDNNQELFGESEGDNSEDEELRKAIAMSMEQDKPDTAPPASDDEDNDMLDVFQQRAVEGQRPLPKGSGRAIANIVNKRAFDAAPESHEVTSFGVPTQKPEESDSEEDTMDFQAALAESRKNKRRTSHPRRPPPPAHSAKTSEDIAKKAGFKGPLPFEKLDLGSSLLGKKKMQERTEEAAGGFENPELASRGDKKKEGQPLPPWFSSDLAEDYQAQRASEIEDRRQTSEFNAQFQFQQKNESTLRRADTSDVIDLEADEPEEDLKNDEIIVLEDDEPEALQQTKSPAKHEEIKMGDVADEVRAEPSIAEPYGDPGAPSSKPDATQIGRSENNAPQEIQQSGLTEENDEMIEWSESDKEDEQPQQSPAADPVAAAAPEASSISATPEAVPEEGSGQHASPSPSPEDFEDVQFEDVAIPDAPEPAVQDAGPSSPARQEDHELVADHVSQEGIPEEEDFDDFSDPEEEEMLRALTLEAEEHARFASTLNDKSTAQNIQEYEKELKQLRNQQKKDRRDADEVTQIMIQECQALLRLFGLPYITAPMEAEAQCAALVKLGLVDGIVTDDSDCFLFGGTRVYKNMFNQAKFVECYLTSDLEKEGLTRDKLIAIAHLLGSDYTEGLPGIGPVTAVEIVSEFGNLDNFREWWLAVQMNKIPKSEDAKNSFRKKFRKNATKLFLPSTFPDQRVDLAYQQPDVDADPEAFQWGVPDLQSLRSFLMSTIGWSQERTDEVLVPVIKDMNRRLDEGTQSNITAFFDGSVGIGAPGPSNAALAGKGEGFAARRRVEGSKRMGSALSRMAEKAKQSSAGVDEADPRDDGAAPRENGGEKSTGSAKKGQKKRKQAPVASGTASSDGDEGSNFEQTARRKSRRKARTTATRRTTEKE